MIRLGVFYKSVVCNIPVRRRFSGPDFHGKELKITEGLGAPGGGIKCA